MRNLEDFGKNPFTFKPMMSRAGGRHQMAFDKHALVVTARHDILDESGFDRVNRLQIGSRGEIRHLPIGTEPIQHNAPYNGCPRAIGPLDNYLNFLIKFNKFVQISNNHPLPGLLMHFAHLVDGGGTGEDRVGNVELLMEHHVEVINEIVNRIPVTVRNCNEELLDTSL